MRILWVEDRPEQIKYHIQLLSMEGHDVTWSGSGEEALEALRGGLKCDAPFDVVLLDIVLPRGEGEMIEKGMRPELMGEEVLRQMENMGVSLPVIGVSAIADEPLRARILADHSSVTKVMKKPFTMDELRAAIHRATGE